MTDKMPVEKARDRNHAIDEADRMWAPESAEDVDPVLLHPDEEAPDPPADPAPRDADFDSDRHGRYDDVHRQTAQIAQGKVPAEPGTYGQAEPAIQAKDSAKTGKDIKT